MFKILSYPIKDGDPTWPGNPTCSLEPHTSIAKGDTANTATIHLFNHYGTHLDGDLAHQIMLGMYQPGYICIVEDINMEELPEGFLKQAAAVPLIIVGIDSCPVTMWAEF